MLSYTAGVETEQRVAFVAGATGYVGREVVRALAEAGVTVHAHVRPDSSRLDESRERFAAMGAVVDTTPWDQSALAERLRELAPSAVFALLGTTRKRARAEGLSDPYDRIDYGLTAMLIRAAAVAGSPRFVYLSSAGVGPRARGGYMRARWRAEQALIASGLPYTIARPAFITGPDRDDARPGERVAATVSDSALRVAALLGGRKLRSRYQSTTNVVLATALVRLAFDPVAANRVIDGDRLR